MKEIVPDFVDDGKLRAEFVLDESASPKRLTETLDYNGPNGPPDPNPIILSYLYRLDDDTLILCSGRFGTFPDEISDEYLFVTFFAHLCHLATLIVSRMSFPDVPSYGRPET